MILWHIALLALIQGISEPLPISSSGHLALFHHILDADLVNDAAQARQIDIAVHIGTFVALVLYFWRDVVALFFGGVETLRGHTKNILSRRFQLLVVASIPAAIAGYFMSKIDASFFYDLDRLALMLILFGLLLGLADKFGPKVKEVGDLTFKNAAIFGVAQILAFIPGVSRSGITMTAGRAMGFDRVSAARFSFLMALVATFGAGVIGTVDVVQAGDFSMGLNFLFAIATSFVTTYAALLFLMKWLTRHDFSVFVVYRVILGFLILGLICTGVLA